jgi:glycosyltransferase involved in cell wall biosynthesis
MTKKNIITLTIGIAAYNAENNIKNLITSLQNQRGNNYKLDKIIIHSDNSTDSTIEIVRKIKDNKLLLIDNKKRKGFSGSIKKIVENSHSDVTLLLNDDIQIYDRHFIEKLINPFMENSKTGLVCGNTQPLPPKNFIDRAITSGFKAYDKARYSKMNGNTASTVDGKILAVSNSFKKTLKFNKNMGNLDGYLYFYCIKQNYLYKNIRSAQVFYRNPTNFEDYIQWFTRNKANQLILEREFGEDVFKSYELPKIKFLYYRILELIKNPLGGIFMLTTKFYIEIKSHTYKNHFSPMWKVVETSKKL